ncbi:MAG TPA: ATP-dependent 6-phosphofructokinase [Gemmatimonadota bacterium]|nr:ATP-dependent 6-phosphofructokinase [Gemmatimonadota bacterium]
MAGTSGSVRRIAVNTGGGDAPGLNAVIRAVVLASLRQGWEVYGIENGYAGLLAGEEGGLVHLTRRKVRGITHLGGTILGTSNRGNPFAWPGEGPDDEAHSRDRSHEVLRAFEEHELDALIAIGGDGSLGIARDLSAAGLPVIGVPKTIDNDLAFTDLSFGFLTAVDTATDAIDKLHSTAESHQRVMVVEVMGRHAGWIALYSGLAGTADAILIPEIPYRIEHVCEKIRAREARGRHFSIVCVAEGAHPVGGEIVTKTVRAGHEKQVRLGGIGERVAIQLADCTEKETRSLALGHLQRGGPPNAYDRLLALRFGSAAVACAEEGRFGCAVGLVGDHVEAPTLEEALEERKFVDPSGDLVRTARDLGISFGD